MAFRKREQKPRAACPRRAEPIEPAGSQLPATYVYCRIRSSRSLLVMTSHLAGTTCSCIRCSILYMAPSVVKAEQYGNRLI